MADIIDLSQHINKRAEKELENVKAQLDIELELIGFDIEKELNKYVLFDTSNYYKLTNDNGKEIVTYEKAMKLLLTAFDMLVKLNKVQAAIEVENIITRLENNSY
jgi:hypothetical protein|tara:strand:- start:8845 stop:9159 length:315 start_codon:yes stop_codon:yes gene_type:complete